jgi:predicted ArsR family transcriptional regulator
MLYYGSRTPVRALPISRHLEMPRETVRRHMGQLVALGLFERAEDQSFVPTKELRKVEIERALRLLRHGTAGLL